MEAGLQQAQRERRERQHLAAPGDGLGLELVQRYDRVDEPPVERLGGVVLAAEEPDLLCPLLADLRGEQRRAEAAVERSDARTRLAEARVVGGDRQVAADLEHLTAADR